MDIDLVKDNNMGEKGNNLIFQKREEPSPEKS